MAVSQDPAVQRRRLRVALRDIRQRLGYSQKDVADALDWSASKLLRIENGTVTIARSDLLALLGYYGIDDPARVEELVNMAQIAKKQTWSQYRDVLSTDTIVYMEFESAASLIRNFMPFAVPGLLQTEEYATALIRALVPDQSDHAVAKIVQARLERQEIFAREEQPEMHFVLDEAVVRRRVGQGRVMIRQLEHLRKVATNPRVRMCILPFEAGVLAGMREPFTILDFPDPADDDLLYVERMNLASRDSREEVERYTSYFFELQEAAVPENGVAELLDQIIDAMEQRMSSA